MLDDKFPQPKQEIDPIQKELIKRLFVCLDDGVSPEILVEHINQKNKCAFVAGRDGGIFLGINHYTMKKGSPGSTFLIDDGYVSNTRLPQYEFFYSGSWSLSSQRLATIANTENLRKAIGEKILTYLESIGINTRQGLIHT